MIRISLRTVSISTELCLELVECLSNGTDCGVTNMLTTWIRNTLLESCNDNPQYFDA